MHWPLAACRLGLSCMVRIGPKKICTSGRLRCQNEGVGSFDTRSSLDGPLSNLGRPLQVTQWLGQPMIPADDFSSRSHLMIRPLRTDLLKRFPLRNCAWSLMQVVLSSQTLTQNQKQKEKTLRHAEVSGRAGVKPLLLCIAASI